MTRAPMMALCTLVSALAALTQPVSAQESDRQGVALEVRGGFAGHGGGDCIHGRTSSATLGIDLRTRGNWIASAAADVFIYGASCLDIGVGTVYEGQQVDIEGWPQIGPRMTVSAGYAFSILGVRAELSGGLGTLPTRTDYGRGGAVWEWRWWQGGMLAARFRSGLAVQIELGRHQLGERYYLVDQDVLVAELLRWERMWRLGLSFPVLD